MTEINMKPVIKETVTIEVKLLNYGQWKMRLWIATLLFRLGAWIAWFDIEIKEDD